MPVCNRVPLFDRENLQWRQSADARYVLLGTWTVILTSLYSTVRFRVVRLTPRSDRAG